MKADPAAIAFYQSWPHGEWGVGIDAVSALDAWGFGMPGLQGNEAGAGNHCAHGLYAGRVRRDRRLATLHFPDGNATIARLLVRNLIPDAIPGKSATMLSRRGHGTIGWIAPVRRTDPTQQHGRARCKQSATAVEVSYVHGGGTFKVRARNCVMACWNMMIPYLCPELPEAQKAALHKLVKTPLVYTSVALRNWEAFKKLKVSRVYAPAAITPTSR